MALSIPSTSGSSTDAELEAVLRLAAARAVIDAALLGDRRWLAGDALRPLCDLVGAAAGWIDRVTDRAA